MEAITLPAFLYFLRRGFILEWETYGEVEGEVAVKIVVEDGVMIATCIGGIDGFHTSIESNDEEVRIHTETYTVADSNLFGKCIQMECTLRLVFVFADGPDITSIHKGGSTEFPKELGTIFKAEVELEVARLVEEVDAPVFPLIGSWS